MKFLSKLFDMLFGWMSPKIDMDSSDFNPQAVAEMMAPKQEDAPEAKAEKAPKKPRKPRAKKAKPELRVEE